MYHENEIILMMNKKPSTLVTTIIYIIIFKYDKHFTISVQCTCCKLFYICKLFTHYNINAADYKKKPNQEKNKYEDTRP